VDKYSQMLDLLRTAPRYEPAARPLLTKAIHRHGVPERGTMTRLTTNGKRPHRNDAVPYAQPGIQCSWRQSRCLRESSGCWGYQANTTIGQPQFI